MILLEHAYQHQIFVFLVHRKKGLAEWNDYTKPARNEALFWHRLWVKNGRPNGGYIDDIRRRTRYKYKHIVRDLKRNQKNNI